MFEVFLAGRTHLLESKSDASVWTHLGGGGRGGQTSKVDYVLRGSVRQDGRRVRVSVQLVRARDESYMWAENFDREWEEEITSESKLAADIVSSLRPTLTALERASR